MIYLDNNATTSTAPEVVAAMAEATQWLNPASQHRAGQAARRVVHQARSEVLEMLGARTRGMAADRLVFTSGGTESNNLAILGLAKPHSRVILSAIEHPSVIEAGRRLANHNIDVVLAPVDSSGRVCLERLERLLAEQPTSLVAVMAANNETGVIQPIVDVVRLAHRHTALVHCDAVQWCGKLPLPFADWDVDSLAFTAHKFHGPVGIGGLCLRSSVLPQPLLWGGFQEDGLRPGTLSVPLVVGLLTALRLAHGFDFTAVTALRIHLEQALVSRFGAIINGADARRMPHTANIAFPGLDRQAFLLAADRHELCISTGSACSSGSSEPSPVLLAMGLDPAIVESSLRLSLSRYTTAQDIQHTIKIIADIINSIP